MADKKKTTEADDANAQFDAEAVKVAAENEAALILEEAKESAAAEAQRIIEEAKEAASAIASEDAEPVQDHGLDDGPWKEKPAKEMKRVFRVEKFTGGTPYNHNIIVVNRAKSILDGSEVPAMVRSLSQNKACQYVLQKGAEEYGLSLAALRVMQKRGIIREVNPDTENALWLPAEVKKRQELEAALRRNQEELDAM